jgi:purine-binding chemotaxis protein CheW
MVITVLSSTRTVSCAPNPISGKHLIFQMGSEEFAIHVMNVREIMKMQSITAVPQAESTIRGVINLRGKIVPVIDLHSNLGLRASENTDLTCIIVIRIPTNGGERSAGIVVDSVAEVLTLNIEDVEPAPDFGLGRIRHHIRGMAKMQGRVQIVLDIEQVLRGENMVSRDEHECGSEIDARS